MLNLTRKEKEIIKIQKRNFGCSIILTPGISCGYRSIYKSGILKHEQSHQLAFRNNTKNNSRFYELDTEKLRNIRKDLGISDFDELNSELNSVSSTSSSICVKEILNQQNEIK